MPNTFQLASHPRLFLYISKIDNNNLKVRGSEGNWLNIMWKIYDLSHFFPDTLWPVIVMDKVPDRCKERVAKVGYSFVTDFKIIGIVPFRREIAPPIQFDLNPGQIFTVSPDYIPAQEGIIHSYSACF